MPRPDEPVRTSDLIQVLSDLGFTANAANGMHTVFRHVDGAVVTVPTGRENVPDVFVRAIVGQAVARNLASDEEMMKRLRPRHRVRREHA